MGKKYKPCIVCGRKIAREIKLPCGSIPLCTDNECKEALNYRLNDGSVPIVWFSIEDLNDHEVLDPSILKKIKKDEVKVIAAAKLMGDFIWDDTMGDAFHTALEEVASRFEQGYVKGMKDKELPLLDIDILQSDEAKEMLETRLKGGKVK